MRLRELKFCLEDKSCFFCGRPLSPPLLRRLAERGDFFDRERDFLCPACRFELPYLEPLCWREEAPGVLLASLFSYDGELRRALLRLKFGGETVLARFFGQAAHQALRLLDYAPAAVLPLPLGTKRLRQRGYNQSALIARELADCRGIACIEDSLIRVRETPPQTSQPDRRAREANLRGAFALADREGWQALRGRPLLLLDDVRTSGASLVSALRCLQTAGLSVRGFSLALEEKKTRIAPASSMR